MDIFTTAYQSLHPRLDDDFCDRVNYYVTSSLFLFFSMVLTARQWIGQPIECWVPAEFRPSWEQYAEDYCFIENTYFYPVDNTPIPRKYADRMSRQIAYYQWVPFILMMEAGFFFFPYMVWWILNWNTGLDIHGIVKTAKQETVLAPEDIIQQHINTLCTFIRHILSLQTCKQPQHRKIAFFGYAQRKGLYVTMVYLLVKLLYLVNSISQLYLLTIMLTTGRSGKGFNMFVDILWGEEWQKSGLFPRVTMCDFEVKLLANVQRHTVQCVLMINMLNEKIFLFLWFWVSIVAVINLISCFQWLIICISSQSRIKYVSRYLRTQLEPMEIELNRSSIEKFVRSFLRFDGVLLLQKLAYHCGDMFTTKIAFSLFTFYAKENGGTEMKAVPGSISQSQAKLEEQKIVSPSEDPDEHVLRPRAARQSYEEEIVNEGDA